MNKIINLTKWDIKFQFKYGFYFLYFIFSLVYSIIIVLLGSNLKKAVASFLIFTDPAAMGLFFMGALFLLEKSQNIHHSLYVSPLNLSSYIIAKIISLSFIALSVAFVLSIVAGLDHYFILIVTIFLTCCIFSLCGLIAALKSDTVNQFMIIAIPFEIVIFIPSFLFFFNVLKSSIWLLHPGVLSLMLIANVNIQLPISISFIILFFWLILIFFICLKIAKCSFKRIGGEV